MDSTPRHELNRHTVLLADGDRTAFRPLFALAWPIVRRFATKFLGDAAHAEDAAQAALLKVFERAATFCKDADALTWILTIAAYECRTIRKRNVRRREGDAKAAMLEETPSAAASPETLAVSGDVVRAVHDFLADLKDTDRETILTILRGDERPDIAGATFRKRAQRALARFRGTWEAKHGDD